MPSCLLPHGVMRESAEEGQRGSVCRERSGGAAVAVVAGGSNYQTVKNLISPADECVHQLVSVLVLPLNNCIKQQAMIIVILLK